MTHDTCRLTANNRDQLLNPTLGRRVWATFYSIFAFCLQLLLFLLGLPGRLPVNGGLGGSVLVEGDEFARLQMGGHPALGL